MHLISCDLNWPWWTAATPRRRPAASCPQDVRWPVGELRSPSKHGAKLSAYGAGALAVPRGTRGSLRPAAKLDTYRWVTG